MVGEAAGVLPLAALKKIQSIGNKIACIISGGNIDVVTVSSLINNGLVSRGRILCFSVDLPDTPGQLLHISQILSDQRANVIKLEHNQFKATDRLRDVQLEITVETNGHDHIASIISKIESYGYHIVRIY